MDRFSRLTRQAKEALRRAEAEAVRYNAAVSPEHLLLALSADEQSAAGKILSSFGLRPRQIRDAFEFAAARLTPPAPTGSLSLQLRASVTFAVARARAAAAPLVGTNHLLFGILEEGEGMAVGILEGLSLARTRLLAALAEDVTDEG